MGAFKGRHALIFAAAPESEYGYIQAFLAGHPDAVIICADGGLRHAHALGLKPDLAIGDFDSGEDTGEAAEVLRLRPEKDDTDTQSCMREAFARGCAEVTLVCATGGRLDHLLANLSLLEEARDYGGRCTLLDHQNMAVLHEGGCQHFKMPGQYRYFSIIPLDEKLQDVTIRGAKYPLEHQTLLRKGMISISNEAGDSPFEVEIGQGTALIIFTTDL
ncbi:thiamine diphosphokinase [Intestinibacillus massiliensis]|uniref:thiamine diphosphokinase n=1 Tax=Intestinibacillus massiliensis TaxID=1871029 RepID=UPI000B3536F3|nr:thiamine diphosphokinase [Intestinibacillus massiliensis]MCB6364675.1 thiamine diphosphokinase [Intestinibacillus massiliensis]